MTTQSTDDRATRLRQAVKLKREAARSAASDFALRPPDQPALLADMQRSLWLLHRLDPNSPAYNLSSAFHLSDSLDVAKLERGFNQVLSRHRILRSTFRAQGNSVQQVIHPHARRHVELVQIEDAGVLATAVDEARKPFDLATGPLVRLLLFQEPTGHQGLLLLVMHHILADERSLVLLWDELSASYNGHPYEAQNQVQYDDFVYWQALRKPDEQTDHRDYWRRQLHPLPTSLVLPFERRSGKARAAQGRLLSRVLSNDTRAVIRRIAAAAGTTPFIIYAFAFRLLLHRYTQGQPVAFATPVSIRSHPATERMLGFFLNPVVIYTAIDEAQTLDLAVQEFNRTMREAYAHSTVSLDALVEELAAVRQPDRHPLFQTMFVYQEMGTPPPLGSVRLEPVTLDLGESKFDLTLFVSENTHALELAVEYRSDRFDEVWMQNLLDHYETLLAHLAEHPARPIAEVSMLRPQDEAALLAYAQGESLNLEGEDLLPSQILLRAERAPQSQAICCGGTRWNYGQLASAGQQIARALVTRGITSGDRVGLFFGRSPWTIAGLLGCHFAGTAYVPLDPDYPVARNLTVLEDAGVAAVVTSNAVAGRLPAGRWQLISTDDLDEVDELISAPLPTPQSDATAYILYTSGSTGQPKGVVVTQANLVASTAARFQFYDERPKRFLLLPSVAFDSSVAVIFWTLSGGGALIIPTDDQVRDPRKLTRLIAEEGVTCLLCVPSLYAHLLDVDSANLTGLEIAIVAGERCSPQLVKTHLDALPQVRLFNEYGPTEATVWSSVHEVSHQDLGDAIAIGRPIPGVRIDVLDELGRRVPPGIPGQAWITGPTVAQGYWKHQALTEQCFRTVGNSGHKGAGERSYRSGDKVVWTVDGRLLFLGREDEQIKLRGFRIEPAEIEGALRELPTIFEAAVVVRSVDSGMPSSAQPVDQQLIAFVETRGAADMVDLQRAMAQRVPTFMVPSRMVELAKLPRLPNGKIDRGGLCEIEINTESPIHREQHITDVREQALISLWEGLLAHTGIGRTDNFFQLGGHSLLVLTMTSAIERDFGVQLSAADVFQNPTVQDLARRIEQFSGSELSPYAHLFPIQPEGERSPFVFCIPHFFSETVARRFRGERPVYGLRGVGMRAEGNLGRWRTMGDLGAELVAEIQRRFPHAPCIVAGYSFGASMAFEAVRLLEQRGVQVHQLYLIAPMPLDFYRVGTLCFQLDGLRKPVDQLSSRELLRLLLNSNHPFTSRPYLRLWRLLVTQPWRHFLCWMGKIRVAMGLPLTSRILHADVRVERFRLHSRYRPGTIRTPTVIFNAKEPATDAAATWRPYFVGPLTVHEIPDPHLDEDSIAAAKKLILKHLVQIDD